MTGNRKIYRQRRHERIRKRVSGTSECPRFSIMISNKNMYVQFIDDERGLTLAAVSTAAGNNRTNIATAKLIGQSAAEAALSKGIKKAVVDRGGYKFHGRLKAIVDALNAAGVLTGAKEAK